MHVLREARFLVHHQGKRFPSLHFFITFVKPKNICILYSMFLSPTQHKSAFITRLLNNPFHPKNKELMQQNYGIQFPHLHKRNEASVSS